MSYEVCRGHLGRNTNEAFAAVATSHNAIRPEDYFTPWLLGPHEIIATVGQDDDTSPAPSLYLPTQRCLCNGHQRNHSGGYVA